MLKHYEGMIVDMFDMMELDSRIIDGNKKKMDELYNGHREVLVTAEWDVEYGCEQLTQVELEEEEYKYLLSNYNRHCLAARAGFDNVPVFSFSAAVAWLMALAYGCEMVKINNLVNAAPKYFTIEDAGKMEKIDKVYNGGLYPMIFERIRKFQDRWGDVPITISDNQSPIDVVTSVFHSEEAMIAMYDDGDVIHHMLGLITDSMIEVNRHYEKSIKNFAGFQSGNYLPYGMHVSDDDAAFLSPTFYSEFAKPYVERLSDEFGGIAFHCCMGHAQNLENLASTIGFMGFDAMADYNPIDKILAAIEGKGVWNIYNYPFAVRQDRLTCDEVWFKDIIDKAKGKCRLLINVYKPDMNEALRLAEKIKEYVIKF